MASCPSCGVPLPADAPAGLCPACLARGAGESADDPLAVEEVRRMLAEHAGELELGPLIGRGGMGFVFRARQKRLSREVAVKVLDPERSGNALFSERFAREAQTLARLAHPNIVAVHDYGRAGELYYLVLEYVDGVNLRQVLRARTLAPEQALSIVPQICEALEFAHAHGVVHRDVKPENILLDRSGRVKMADFGLAKLLGVDFPRVSLTSTGLGHRTRVRRGARARHRLDRGAPGADPARARAGCIGVRGVLIGRVRPGRRPEAAAGGLPTGCR